MLVKIIIISMLILICFVIPASAVTTTIIDFEDLGFDLFVPVESHYSGDGVVFDSSVVTFCGPIFPGLVPYSGYTGICSMNNAHTHANTRIDFTIPVSRVKIWFYATSYGEGFMGAYDSNDQAIGYTHNANSNSWDYLEISSTSQNIAYVMIRDEFSEHAVYEMLQVGPNMNIVYDDLEFDRDTTIPEFPTIALPVISLIGLMFLLQRRKGK